jgi:hypothetical protein
MRNRVEVVCIGRPDRPHELRQLARFVDARENPLPASVERQAQHAALTARLLPGHEHELIEPRHGIAVERVEPRNGGLGEELSRVYETNRRPAWHRVRVEQGPTALVYTVPCRDCRTPRGPREVQLGEVLLGQVVDLIVTKVPTVAPGVWRVELSTVERLTRHVRGGA